MISQRGVVYTFYSFKGGVGRSMALANVAALLAKREKNVLVIDWDLEAPGLEKYFSKPPSLIRGSRKLTPGVVDIVTAFAEGKPLDWQECVLYAQPFNEGTPISLISAGQDTQYYVERVQKLNWERLFDDKEFGSYLETLREEWLSKFDFVLIDSRTGITDIGGICTIHLPDILVILFTANEQSLDGVTDVVERAKAKYSSLPFDRAKLLAVPVPSRFENVTEYKLAAEWKHIFAERLSKIYADWLPDRTTSDDILEKLFIPNVPFWSFGEELPVVKEGTSDPRSLGFAYDILARLLENRLQWNQVIMGDFSLSSDRSPESVDQTADRIFESLSEVDRNEAMQIFGRLVRVGRSSEEDSRRKASQAQFQGSQKNVIDKLIDNRLLYVNLDANTKEPTIEIAQDSLLKNWQRLRQWIDDNRDYLVWREGLNLRIMEWRDSDRDDSLLLDGAALAKAERFMRKRDDDLSSNEKEFVRHSAAEKERRLSEERRRKTLTWTPFAASFVVLGAFLTAGMYFYRIQTERFQAQQAESVQQLKYQQVQAERQLADSRDQFNKLSAQLDELRKQNEMLTEQLRRRSR